jgi:hypothetical protein
MHSRQITVLQMSALLSIGLSILACGGSSRGEGGMGGDLEGGSAGGSSEGGVSSSTGTPTGGGTGSVPGGTGAGGSGGNAIRGTGGTVAGGSGSNTNSSTGGTAPVGTGGTPATGGTPGNTGGAVCTQILAAPQSPDWYIDGIFEGLVGVGRFELLGGGTGINHYGSSTDAVWNDSISHRCTTGSGKPDRVMLVVWGHSGYSTAAEWANKLREVIPVIRMRRPTARQIILQPAAGGRGCSSGYASQDLDTILAAAQTLAGPDILVGTRPEVTCADITGKFDELSPEGARKVGRLLGEFYSR